MEVVGGVAGVVTFLTFTLRSTKALYEIVSSLKNARQHVGNLAMAVQSLQSVLTELLNSHPIKRADP